MSDIERKNNDSYMNLKGTTCKSFKIGKTSISFASEAIRNKDDIDWTQFRHFVVKNVRDGDPSRKVIYDCEINMKAVDYVEEKSDSGGSYPIIHLMDGTAISLKGSVSGSQIEIDENKTSDKSIVIYDATKKVLTNAGFTIMNSEDFKNIVNVDEGLTGVEKLNALASALNADKELLDEKVPSMQAVIDYVGTIDSILDARLNGNLPI